MPVPAPVFNHSFVHPIQKPSHNTDNNTIPELPGFQSVFGHIAHSLTQQSAGPPAGFPPREEWLDILPSWRREQPRHIVDHNIRENEGGDRSTCYQEDCEQKIFCDGLIATVDVPISKGELAEASHPPVYHPQGTHLPRMVLWTDESGGLQFSGPNVADNLPQSAHRNRPLSDGNLRDWNASCLQACDQDGENAQAVSVWESDVHIATHPMRQALRPEPSDRFHSQVYMSGSFPVICEGDSPYSPGSLTPDCCRVAPRLIEHTTPFGEFVDRVVDDPQVQAVSGSTMHSPSMDSLLQDDKQQPAACEPAMGPDAIRAYRQMAEPLAEWLAEYVWKVCTTGLSLPPRFVGSGAKRMYSLYPPPNLGNLIRTLLCSTLLQNSDIILALWYIAHLPVFFDWHDDDLAIHPREIAFRAELFGEAYFSPYEDQEMMHAYVPFRLILLGCMLANKWLDDHTFSNKTWQTISEVPIQQINSLEFLALDVFSHNLSVPPHAWDQWLSDLRFYLTSSSPYPSPIERPSAVDPKTIIRRMVEELISSPPTSTPVHVHANSSYSQTIPNPSFVGLAGRIQEKAYERRRSPDVDALEIDLDEDGPLREEYVPRRRVSAASATGGIRPHTLTVDEGVMERPSQTVVLPPLLPPPAKWSPSADPPIERQCDRGRDRYIAVQASASILANHTSSVLLPTRHVHLSPPQWFGRRVENFEDVGSDTDCLTSACLHLRQPTFTPTARDCNASVHPCPSGCHARSHSLSLISAQSHSRNRSGSYLQTLHNCNENGIIDQGSCRMSLGARRHYPLYPYATKRPCLFPIHAGGNLKLPSLRHEIMGSRMR